MGFTAARHLQGTALLASWKQVGAAVLTEKEAFNKVLKETKSCLYHCLKPEDFSQVFIPFQIFVFVDDHPFNISSMTKTFSLNIVPTNAYENKENYDMTYTENQI